MHYDGFRSERQGGQVPAGIGAATPPPPPACARLVRLPICRRRRATVVIENVSPHAIRRVRTALAVAAVIAAAGSGLVAAGPASAAPAPPFNLITELQNFSITGQRQTVYDTASYQLQLATIGTVNGANALAGRAADPSRTSSPTCA